MERQRSEGLLPSGSCSNGKSSGFLSAGSNPEALPLYCTYYSPLDSDCGYDHNTRKSKTRRVAVDFTGCLAHAEILSEVVSGRILMVRGFFGHNEGCKQAFMKRIPPVPLHPSVYFHALKQLGMGAQLTDIQAANRTMFAQNAYSEQPQDLSKSPYRWLIQKYDTRSLYRQFNRLRGLRTVVAPHINVHEWLDPSSPSYKKEIASAVFHYSARAEKDDRFEVCIATEAMQKAAWKYCHASQLILDGTFGVCDRKMLLFIAMGVDERGHGVPVAFFLFSAPSGNKKTDAGYNTEILEKLLLRWKTTLDAAAFKPSREASFTPKVAITDTDLKERSALVRVFPDIWLLICKFHLRQSWRNHRARVLKGTSTLHTHVRSRLRDLEDELINSLDHSQGMAAIERERAVIASEVDPQDVQLAEAALEHLTYLGGYWMSESLWRSWSAYGRQEAAGRLGFEVNMVLTTTNHLESFNGILKRKHLVRWQRGNRRLRLDVLLHLLITNIIPSLFEARALEQKERTRLSAMLKALPGGDALAQEKEARDRHAAPQSQLSSSAAKPACAVYILDPTRDIAASEMFSEKQISVPTFSVEAQTFEFDCFSSRALASDILPIQYKIAVGLDGSAACSCPDFMSHGHACKHIRAALLQLNALRKDGLNIPPISLPTSTEEARARFDDQRPPAIAGIIVSSPPISSSPQLPAARVMEHAGNVVADIVRESGDAFEGPDSEAVFIHGARTPERSQTPSPESPHAPSLMSAIPEVDAVRTALASESPSPTLMSSARDGINRQAVGRVLHELECIAPRLREMLAHLEGVTLIPAEVFRTTEAKSQLDAVSSRLSQLLTAVSSDSGSIASGMHAPASDTAPSSTPHPSPSLSCPGAAQTTSPVAASVSRKRHAADTPSSPRTPQRRRETYLVPIPEPSNVPTIMFPTRSHSRRRQKKPALSILPPSPEKPQKRKESHCIH